jgi:demethylmenaquinone methyltransferase/2-methoxy-6-polyprenyl-1,4-benzoquinol methylase
MLDEYFFARFYDPFVDPYIRKIRHKVLNLAMKHRPENILDVCCGTGHQLKLLKKHGFIVTGLDLSDNMLKISRKGKHAPVCIKGDATAMPFEDNSFDMVTISLALHENTPETARNILLEITRIARVTGTIILIDYEITGKTRKDARIITRTIEWMAGGEHYRNFRQYIQIGGLDRLIEGLPLTLRDEFRYAGHSLVVKVMGKKV